MQPTLEQLKAYAYDCGSNINYWNLELQKVNQIIEREQAKLPKTQEKSTEPQAQPSIPQAVPKGFRETGKKK